MGRGNSENGLRIKRKLSLRQSVSRIPVVTALEPEDCCDVIFVAVRYTQIETILDALIGQIFASTKYKVTYEPNMGDYLLCHAAFVLPAAFACYKTDGNLKRLRGDTACLNRLIDANIEGYRAFRDAGHEILPDGDKEFEGAAYRKTCLRFFQASARDEPRENLRLRPRHERHRGNGRAEPRSEAAFRCAGRGVSGLARTGKRGRKVPTEIARTLRRGLLKGTRRPQSDNFDTVDSIALPEKTCYTRLIF